MLGAANGYYDCSMMSTKKHAVIFVEYSVIFFFRKVCCKQIRLPLMSILLPNFLALTENRVLNSPNT